jgi:hypothetical protein
MASIFGSGAPAIQLESELLHLTHCIVTDNSYTDVITHTSIINNVTNHIGLGDYAYFDIMIFLGKGEAGNGTTRTAKQFYTLLNSIENTTVSKYYLHSDGEPFKDKDGVEVPFYIELVEPAYLEDTYYYDICRVKLKSTKYVCYTTSTGGFGYDYGEDYGG